MSKHECRECTVFLATPTGCCVTCRSIKTIGEARRRARLAGLDTKRHEQLLRPLKRLRKRVQLECQAYILKHGVKS